MSLIKRFLPKDTNDLPAFVFMNGAFCSITLYEIFHVLPTVDDKSKFGMAFHLLVGLYFFANIYGNFIKLILTDSSTRGMMLPTTLQENWRFCHTCECNSPPRSWHCNICNTCVMRRDHHCTFAGVCVGHRNYRYFLMMLLHLSVCGAYINIINAEFAYDILGGFNLGSALAMIMPWAAWLLGIHGPFTFVVAFMSSLTLFGSLLAIGYFIYQINLVSQGRTSFEIQRGTGREYDVGRFANLKQIFGKNWKLVWLFPWVPSEMYTDGTSFPTKFTYEEVKDL
ncbi:probable palmitoyltransferase ZDHHC24 [Watersipora subatra]|uniref:probable palmitoyltransferase ZDHHC24 n=1 Tax=Watersipora subatra TaxID=2589382 RepID=UPI00355C84C1